MRRFALATALFLVALGAGLAWSADRGVRSEPSQLVSAAGNPDPPENVSLTRIGSGYLAAWQSGEHLTLRRLGAKGKPIADAVEFDEAAASYAIAYDSKLASVLIAYSAVDPRSGAVTRVVTQRLSTGGAPIGPPHEFGARGYAMALHYDPRTAHFVLATSDGAAVRTWRLDAEGGPDAGPHVVFGQVSSCALADRALAGQFLLACKSGGPGKSDGTVIARRLTRSGAPHGKAIEFGAPGRQQNGSPGVSVATGPKRWLLCFLGKTRVLVRALDATGQRRGGTSFNGLAPHNDAAISVATLPYSPQTKAALVVWEAQVPGSAGSRVLLRARLVDGSSLKAIGPLYKGDTEASGHAAALAPDYVLLIDDAERAGFSLYSRHLVAHR
jgi:hypothetical protein